MDEDDDVFARSDQNPLNGHLRMVAKQRNKRGLLGVCILKTRLSVLSGTGLEKTQKLSVPQPRSEAQRWLRMCTVDGDAQLRLAWSGLKDVARQDH